MGGGSGIDSPCVDIPYLARIMRFLVRKRVFTQHNPSDGGETLYGLTDSSKWLLRDSEVSLAPMVLMQNYPWQLAPWHYLSQCVKEGGIAFKKAHGCEIWDLASQNPEFNRIFNDALACTAKIIMRAVVSHYKGGFDDVETLVDVGGGTGGNLAEIVKAYPHIKGINFDLPHVVAAAPAYNGVSHVGGNFFEAIPNADSIFMKVFKRPFSAIFMLLSCLTSFFLFLLLIQWVLHDWGDEDCVKILKNCRKAMPEKTGKLILVEIVLQPEGNGQFGDMGMVSDLVMFAHSTGGKERTELEWKKLLDEGGFPRYKIINIPALPSIIEAYLQ